MSNFFNMCKYDVWKHEFALAAMSSTGGRTVALPQLLAVCGSLSAAFTDSLSMVHSLKADVKPIIRLQWYHIFIVEFIFLLSGGGGWGWGQYQSGVNKLIHKGGFIIAQNPEAFQSVSDRRSLDKLLSIMDSSHLVPYYRREQSTFSHRLIQPCCLSSYYSLWNSTTALLFVRCVTSDPRFYSLHPWLQSSLYQ